MNQNKILMLQENVVIDMYKQIYKSAFEYRKEMECFILMQWNAM